VGSGYGYRNGKRNGTQFYGGSGFWNEVAVWNVDYKRRDSPEARAIQQASITQAAVTPHVFVVDESEGRASGNTFSGAWGGRVAATDDAGRTGKENK